MDRWQYTGTGTPRSYGDYVDAATGRQLDAQPGEAYEIRATWDKLPVPPADGWWKPAEGNETIGDGGQATPPSGGAGATSQAPDEASPAGKARSKPTATS
jgi:hypothetical protein